jgi:hypothetical protein
MQKFLFVNTKGFSLEQSILAMHANLQKIHEAPETSLLEIQSVNFVNTFEKPAKGTLDISPAANQPVIVYNCCVVLVEPKPRPDIDGMVAKWVQQLKGIYNAMKDDDIDLNAEREQSIVHGFGVLNAEGDQPSDKEIKDLREATSFLKRSEQFNCKHVLGQQRFSKDYRNLEQYYQICSKCGAEVWHGIDDEHPAPGAPGHLDPSAVKKIMDDETADNAADVEKRYNDTLERHGITGDE